MALNDDEYGVIPMEISTDDDTDESKERRKNNKQSVLDQNQQKLPFEIQNTQNSKTLQPQNQPRRILRAQRQFKNGIGNNANNLNNQNNEKWKCVCCKTQNENNVFECCNCMIPRPRLF